MNLERAGLTLPVQVGRPVQVGDRVRTGVDGAVGITLADDTLLTAGPNSTLLINDFRFDPTTRAGNMLTTLLQGTLSVVTGLLARQSPENVGFRTPNVVLGIRGTEFIIEVRGEGE
ncbi:MAG: FecR domain-containing protein [Candidatus Accumulibacter sp.]|nr:FecR domain-containing protein [Accumulibacter sp.]